MKTTENISLAGYAFTIETDAYEELGTYLEDIRKSFSGDSSADEITSDIEERIAELLSERCSNGTVVNLSMIKDIRKRIGNPEELAQEDPATGNTAAEPHTNNESKSWKSRKIYRDIDERILGGVCSGLGAYSGLDKVIFRVLFLIFFLVGFSDEGLFCIPMVLYICLWIAMPAARTVEQKCEMKGKPINLEGFRSKDFDLGKEVNEAVNSPAGKTIGRIFCMFIGLTLLVCGAAGLLACIFIPALPSIIDSQIGLSGWESLDSLSRINAEIVTGPTFWGLVLMTMVLGFIGMLYGGIMMTFDLKAPSWKPGLVIFIAWLLSLFVTAGWVIKTFADSLPGMLV